MNSDGVPIGSKFSDFFGEYEVIGEPTWSGPIGGFVQDVRTPEGHITINAVEALRALVSKENQ